MKRKILLLTSLLAITALTGCEGEAAISMLEPGEGSVIDNTAATYPDELLLNHKVVGILVDEDYQLSALQQADYDASNLRFTSANPEIATVNKNGKIKGVSAGETEITVADKSNPNFSKTVKVIVAKNANSQMTEDLATHFKELSEPARTSMIDNELYEKRVYKNNELVSYNRYDQHLVLSYDDAYLGISEKDAEIKTENGAINYSNTAMTFYTNPSFDTYIYRHSGDVKRYYVAATQAYMDGPRYEPMLKVLDNIYTSGRDIFLNTFDNAKIKSFSSDINDYTADDRKLGSNGADELVFSYSVTFANETADQDDETNYGIPYGTPTPSVQTMRYIVKNDRMIAYTINLVSTYEIGKDKYVATYDIDHMFEDIDENKSQIVIPDKREYTKVDSLFSVF